MSPPQERVAHRALDGRRFLISGPLDLSAPATSVVEVTVDGRRHELTAGPANLGRDVAREVGVDRFDEELRYEGGTLLTARTRPYDPRIRLREERLTAVWEGGRHSLFTHLYRATSSDVLGVLRALRLDEHPDGLAVRPRRRSAFAAPATVVKEVGGLGLLELSPLTPRHAEQLPRWRGRQTPAGELFRDQLSDGSPYFVLAGRDVWATVLPLSGAAADQAPELIGQLRLATAE